MLLRCHLVTRMPEMPINTGESESDMLLKHVTLLVTLHLTLKGGGKNENRVRTKRSEIERSDMLGDKLSDKLQRASIPEMPCASMFLGDSTDKKVIS